MITRLRKWGLGGTHTGVAPIPWVTSGKSLSGAPPLEVQVVLGTCHSSSPAALPANMEFQNQGCPPHSMAKSLGTWPGMDGPFTW